ncbi:MAG: hypothetical protein AAGG11_16310 [Pseudomonadota bacterium]
MTQTLLFPLLLFVLTVAVLLGTAAYVHYRMLKLGEQLAQTSAQVDVFAEACVALGEFVMALRSPDTGLENTAPAAAAPGAARTTRDGGRTLLLRRAVQDYQEGVPLEEVARSCHLSPGEASLLGTVPRAQAAPRPARA